MDVAVIEDTGWVSACMSYCIAHLAHLSKLTSRFLISIGPFAEIRGGSSAMQAFAGVCAAMVASTLLEHTALRGIIESKRLGRLDLVHYLSLGNLIRCGRCRDRRHRLGKCVHVLLYSPLGPLIEVDFAFPNLHRTLRRDPRWELRDASLCGRMSCYGGINTAPAHCFAWYYRERKTGSVGSRSVQEPVPRELKFECAFRFECAMPEVCI